MTNFAITQDATDTAWEVVSPLACIRPNTGVAALIRGQQIALIRVCAGGKEEIYALDNRDPFSGAMVIARGIVGEREGIPTIASPIYKQVFDLRNGICFDSPDISLRTFPARIREQAIELHLGTRIL